MPKTIVLKIIHLYNPAKQKLFDFEHMCFNIVRWYQQPFFLVFRMSGSVTQDLLQVIVLKFLKGPFKVYTIDLYDNKFILI